jgi:hypothetical protein
MRLPLDHLAAGPADRLIAPIVVAKIFSPHRTISAPVDTHECRNRDWRGSKPERGAVAMTCKINSIPYEDSVMKLPRDRILGKAFMTFCKNSLVMENINFLKERYDPKKMYNTYIKAGSRFQINIPGAMRAKADTLATGGGDVWKHKDWKKVIKECMDEVEGITARDTVTSFFCSEEFMEVHREQLMKKVSVPSKALSLLGVKDSKSLKVIMVLLITKEFAEAKKLSARLIQNEKLGVNTNALLKDLNVKSFA